MGNLHAERDRLDHQRSRIEEILAHRAVSSEMESQLRERLGEIRHRLLQMGHAALPGAAAVPWEVMQHQASEARGGRSGVPSSLSSCRATREGPTPAGPDRAGTCACHGIATPLQERDQ